MGRRLPCRAKFSGWLAVTRHGVSRMPVTNTSPCSSQIDPHRVVSDSINSFQADARRAAIRQSVIVIWSECTLMHSLGNYLDTLFSESGFDMFFSFIRIPTVPKI